MTRIDEQLLLDRILKYRDEDAFRQIFDEHQPGIRRFLIYKLPTENDAEDIESEVFFNAWKYLTSVKVEKVRALLYKISRNAIAGFYSKRPVWQVAITEELEAVLGDEGVEMERIQSGGELAVIKTAVPRLRDSYRELIELHFLEGLPVEEIALLLGKNENNIRVTLFRAVQALKELLQDK